MNEQAENAEVLHDGHSVEGRGEIGYIHFEVNCNMKKLFAIVFFGFASLVPPTWSQELDCEVIVNTDKLTSSARDYLKNFESEVRQYLNGNRWTDEDLGGEKIHCSMNIFFLNASGNDRYQAQAVIVSQRPIYGANNEKTNKSSPILRINDDRWEFTYTPNQRMVRYENQVDPLTDFLNFYAYLIVGFDLETYEEFKATRYFEKALNICNQATSSPFGSDWRPTSVTYSRFGIADELMNGKYQSFRLAFTKYHFDGLDLLAAEKEKGLGNILQAIESLGELRQRENPRSVLVKTFFDAKHLEIAEIFLQYGDRSVYKRLATADPQHQGTYEDYRIKP